MSKVSISEDLFFNIVKDWEKRQITLEEKSLLLQEYLKQTGLSQRGLAKKLGISHSTFHDWVSMRQEKTRLGYVKNELESLLSRLLFVVSRTEDISEKSRTLIGKLQIELEAKLK